MIRVGLTGAGANWKIGLVVNENGNPIALTHLGNADWQPGFQRKRRDQIWKGREPLAITVDSHVLIHGVQNQKTVIGFYFEFREIPTVSSIDFGIAHHSPAEYASFSLLSNSVNYSIRTLCFGR